MAEQKESPPVAIAAETMHGDLIALVIDELKAAPDVWQKLGEAEQDDIIDRVRRRTGEAIEECVRMISTAGFTRLPAKLESVQIKDGIKATLSCSQHDAARLDLYDAQGNTVFIVLANPEAFAGGANDTKADPDQGALVLHALDKLGQAPGSKPEGSATPGDGA